MGSLNIEDVSRNYNTWIEMLVRAANSNSEEQSNRLHICKFVDPNGTCTLGLKTDAEIKVLYKEHGSLCIKCCKLDFKDVMNITRIVAANLDISQDKRLKEALKKMAEGAGKKI